MGRCTVGFMALNDPLWIVVGEIDDTVWKTVVVDDVFSGREMGQSRRVRGSSGSSGAFATCRSRHGMLLVQVGVQGLVVAKLK